MRRGRPVGAISAPDRRRERSAAPLAKLSFPEWCDRYLVQSVDRWAGQPLVLEDFQREVMDEALARDGDSFRWKTIVLVLPRKNGKTSRSPHTHYSAC